jgi:hypothetical protein
LHDAPLHESVVVQGLPSSHVVPWPCTQPAVASQLSVVHGLPSLQLALAPGMHALPLQTSPMVHTLPSLQGLALLAEVQPPWASQVSVVHALPSSQMAGTAATQSPPAHFSPVVQFEPSSHGPVPLTYTHPALASHASVVHGLLSLQGSALPPTHAPLLQASPTVHALPSLQPLVVAPLAVQPLPGAQPSRVQPLPSSQTVGVAPPHSPATHVSPVVHALPSSQEPLMPV